MDDVKLEQANTLQKNIKIAKENLYAWENSTGFQNSTGVAITYKHEKDYFTTAIAPATPETFIVVKALNVHHWRQQVADFEKQYSEL